MESALPLIITFLPISPNPPNSASGMNKCEKGILESPRSIAERQPEDKIEAQEGSSLYPVLKRPLNFLHDKGKERMCYNMTGFKLLVGKPVGGCPPSQTVMRWTRSLLWQPSRREHGVQFRLPSSAPRPVPRYHLLQRYCLRKE